MKGTIKMKTFFLIAAIAVFAASASVAMASGWTDDFNSYPINQALPSPWSSSALQVVSDGAGGQYITDTGSFSQSMRAWGASDISTFTGKFKLSSLGTSGACDIGLGSNIYPDTHYAYFEAINDASSSTTKLYFYYTLGAGPSANIDPGTWYDVMLAKDGLDWVASYKKSADTSWTTLGTTSGSSFPGSTSAIDSALIKVYGGFGGSPVGSTFIDNVRVSSPQAPVPEPASLVTVLTGSALLFGLKRK